MARYGHQQLWPDGVINAPWGEVLDVYDAINALLKLESPIDSKKED